MDLADASLVKPLHSGRRSSCVLNPKGPCQECYFILATGSCTSPRCSFPAFPWFAAPTPWSGSSGQHPGRRVCCSHRSLEPIHTGFAESGDIDALYCRDPDLSTST